MRMEPWTRARIRSHLRRMAAAGIGVYLGGGGSGEGYVLSHDETKRLLEIGVEELAGKVPVRAMGVEPRTSGDMIDYVEMAAGVGIEAAQVYSLDQGHGHRPNHAEIYRYFDDVLSAITLPVVLSTHQSVGYQVPLSMLVEYADRFDHLIGINVTHQDLGYLASIVDALGDRLEIHVGGPNLALTALSLGATGYLSSEGNLAPKLCVGVIDAYRRQRRPPSRRAVRGAASPLECLVRSGRDPLDQGRPQRARPTWRVPPPALSSPCPRHRFPPSSS